MSTSYEVVGRKRVKFSEFLKDLPDGLKVDKKAKNTKDNKCITDGENYLWSYADTNGNLGGFDRYGVNYDHDILEAIAGHFKIRIRGEHDQEFPSGFSSEQKVLHRKAVVTLRKLVQYVVKEK